MTLHIDNMLNVNHISLNDHLPTQKDVFERIAELAVVNGIASSKKSIVDGLTAREEESTTGFMDGFAIPHTQVDDIQKPGIVVVSTDQGVEWNSMDGEPARFIIALLIPANEAGTTHLNALASLSRMLMHDEVRRELLSASNAEDVLERITSTLAKQD